MDMNKVFEFINKEIPAHAQEIWSAIDLLANAIENSRCAIDGTIGKLSSNREYAKANEYILMSQNIADIIDRINEYSKKYFLKIKEDEAEKEIIEDDEDEEADGILPNEKIDYEKYRVDEEVAYNLYTDFTHKKPAAFSLNGKKYSARKWKYVFIQTCEILADIDSRKFNLFLSDSTMQGRTRAYFSMTQENIRKPKQIKGTNIYVETNLSANNIRNIIIDMLEKYNIPKNQYQIYLSKDLTPLHRDREQKLSKGEGGVIKERTTELSKDSKTCLFKPEDFRFSKQTVVQESNPMMNGLNEKMGTPSHIEYLKMSEGDTRRHKSRCVEYDAKKNVCECVQSPYFTMHCGGSSHCKYYVERKKEKDYIKEKIYVISEDMQKKRKCTKCQGKTEREMLNVIYYNGSQMISNKLGIYVCQICGRKHLINTLYRTYTNNKDIHNISVEFVNSDRF